MRNRPYLGTHRRSKGARSSESDYYDALKRITQYDSVERLRKRAEKEYGLSPEEAIEMAYENVKSEAEQVIKGKRRPK